MNTIKIAVRGAFNLPIDDIHHFQGDLKTLSIENFEKLKKEILETGFAFAPHVWQNPDDKRWMLLDGHQRCNVLRELQRKGYDVPPVPVNPVEAKDFKEARRRVLQGTSQYGEMTSEGLYEFALTSEITFEDLADSFVFPEIDFDQYEKEFGNGEPEGEDDEDEVPAVPVEAKTKLGDLYRLGDHRLLCGDSTDAAMVSTLVGQERMDMVFTDPPYNLGGNMDSGIYSGTSLKSHTELAATKWDDNFDIKPIIRNLLSVLSENSSMYVCTSHFLAGDIWAETKNTMDRIGWCVWDKNNPTPSMQKRHWTWCAELICYATKGKHTFNFPDQGHAPNVWRFNKEAHTEGHPTQKPVTIPEHAILHSSKSDDNVIDLFGGSGSTLIACEKTNRKCFMMELDPHYVDVIVSRYCKFTGATKVIKNGQEIDWIVDSPENNS